MARKVEMESTLHRYSVTMRPPNFKPHYNFHPETTRSVNADCELAARITALSDEVPGTKVFRVRQIW